MKCLIIAAGQGSRLRSLAEAKPLIPLKNTPLIERVIDSAMEAGVDDFYVVVGYQGSSVRSHLEKVSRSKKVPITIIENEEWERANGISVLKAKSYLNEPFLLMMGDHIFDPEIARLLIHQSSDNEGIVLAVDEDLGNSFIDMEDVTRVLVQENRIQKIGKGMEPYNCFDTGIFLCDPALFTAIESSAKNGDDSLSGGVRFLAKQGKAQAMSINGFFWCDIDDPKNFKQAEEYLSSLAENCA
ncbi:MAG: phosphocholine cytidylyltransferase family protein [Nitrospinae bacterium]|nr:phosphocholine cytidylyltransferase family protein [Nitrospinota bacterium]